MGHARRRRFSAEPRPSLPRTRPTAHAHKPQVAVAGPGTPLALTGEGLDFSAHLRRLCTALVADLPELAHIDLERVGIGCVQVRRAGRHGILATTTPLRFAGGAALAHRLGSIWRVPEVVDAAGRQLLYLIKFYLPRFCDHSLEEKLTTVIHELWHIGPDCDGDLRRHAGRCHAHGRSRSAYDDQMGVLMRRWLANGRDASCLEFLRHDFRGLLAMHARVVGETLPTPRLMRVLPRPPARLG